MKPEHGVLSTPLLSMMGKRGSARQMCMGSGYGDTLRNGARARAQIDNLTK
jgi:hypothetical protein